MCTYKIRLSPYQILILSKKKTGEIFHILS